MHQKSYNEAIVSKIIENYYNEHPLDLIEASKNNFSPIYKACMIPELCAKIFPYFEYDNPNVYRADIEKLKDNPDFPQILKDSLLTNKELFKDYTYNAVYLRTIAVDCLDKKTLSILDESVFKHVHVKPVEEVQMQAHSYLINKNSFYNRMDKKTLMETGQSQITEFIQVLEFDLGIIEKLKIDRLINYQIIAEETKNIQLVIINPRDKKLLDAFIEELPNIYRNVFDSLTTEEQNSCNFRGKLDSAYKAIDHLSLSQKLGNKENIQKPKKI